LAADNTVTIGTPLHEYSGKIDYFRVLNDDGFYHYKNLQAKDPKGPVLIPRGQTITITLQTNEPISGDSYGYRTSVALFNHKVPDCQIFFRFGFVKAEDKMALKIINIEQTDGNPSIAKLTLQVPDKSDVDVKHFTKLFVSFPYSPEAQYYYLISKGVHVK
jgi:hypothetical protein